MWTLVLLGLVGAGGVTAWQLARRYTLPAPFDRPVASRTTPVTGNSGTKWLVELVRPPFTHPQFGSGIREIDVWVPGAIPRRALRYWQKEGDPKKRVPQKVYVHELSEFALGDFIPKNLEPW